MMTDINIANVLKNIDSQDKKNGLYIIATPIGNLLDISFRALFMLTYADRIFAEDTRVTRKLLSFYGITSKELVSCNEHNSAKLSTEIVAFLSGTGRTAVLVSDAGTPLVSDPGYRVVNECIKNNIYVTSVPGPSSVVNGLVLSGLMRSTFFFYGFLPYKKVARVKELEKLKNYETVIVFLESPYRIEKMLVDVFDVFGDVSIALAREMTKKFEEVTRGKISEIIRDGILAKGEFVVILDNSHKN